MIPQGAKAAIESEWEKLLRRQCFFLEEARDWKSVKAEAAAQNKLIHLGSLLELCYEKHSELAASEGRKYKGRVVFLGDRVKDQFGATAVFEELASSPAGMEAAVSLTR